MGNSLWLSIVWCCVLLAVFAPLAGRTASYRAQRLRLSACSACRRARRRSCFLTLSRTVTTPSVTRVSVLVQVSCTSHVVPRTVAALYLPAVRNAPLPLPHSLRVFDLLGGGARLPEGFLQPVSGSVSVRSVSPPARVSLKMPSENSARGRRRRRVMLDRALLGVHRRADRDLRRRRRAPRTCSSRAPDRAPCRSRRSARRRRGGRGRRGVGWRSAVGVGGRRPRSATTTAGSRSAAPSGSASA